MGLTVHYRGRFADLYRIEDFEDRVLDLVLEIGGTAEIWRSTADDGSGRMVRGIIATLAPGQEPTSLLVSPEGWLINLLQIEEAERGLIREPPWCWVKTQFGPVEAHVSLVELLRSLQTNFVADLEVNDEGGYWESRDVQTLIKKHTFLRAAIDGIQEGLERHGLSREAAEDPEIVATRVERIVAQVQRIIGRPSEHPNPFIASDDLNPDEVESQWDAIFRHNRRRQERLHRAVEERLQKREPHDEALENAFRDIGLPVPGDPSFEDGDADDIETESSNDLSFDDLTDMGEYESRWESDESWKDADDDAKDPFEREQHPLLRQAMDLNVRLREVFRQHQSEHEAALRSLYQGAGDLMGGLSQATSPFSNDEGDDHDSDLRGLHIVQLKRAIRGAAFARGALFQLRNTIDEAMVGEIHETLKDMDRDLYQLLGETRAALRPNDP